jgi:hypothetical protein
MRPKEPIKPVMSRENGYNYEVTGTYQDYCNISHSDPTFAYYWMIKNTGLKEWPRNSIHLKLIKDNQF